MYATAAPQTGEVPGVLQATPRQQQVALRVAQLVEREHYAHQTIDDRLSEQILKNYLEALDGNRQYFLEPDIVYFSRYRHSLDDVLQTGDIEPVFDIFRLYRLRAQQHLSFALSQLQKEPDFTMNEDFVFDREKAPWIATPQEMQENWRKRVKNDALSLLMADKQWPEASEILRKRYERVLKRINELDGDDVFETFMNSFARTLDPHSSYLNPRQSEEYRIQMSLSYQGIGASLQLDDEIVKVLNVIPGGPAAIDGRLKASDKITGVGQGTSGEIVDVVGWQLDDVVQLIRGPQGTSVRLQVQPADAPPGTSEQVLDPGPGQDQARGAGGKKRGPRDQSRRSCNQDRHHYCAQLLPGLRCAQPRRRGLRQHDARCPSPAGRSQQAGDPGPGHGSARQRRGSSDRGHGSDRVVH